MAKTRYVWCSVSDSVLQEKDGNTGVTKVTYTNEPAPYGPLRSEHRGSETRQYHFDALGTTRALTDDSQTVTDTFSYDAWGEPLSESGNSTTPYLWIGRFGYASCNLFFIIDVRRRNYDAETARWQAIDPLDRTLPAVGLSEINFASYSSHSSLLQEVEYQIAHISQYLYSNNRPTAIIDPSGLQGFSCCGPQARCTGDFPGVGAGPAVKDKYCSTFDWLQGRCCTAAQLAIAKTCCASKCKKLGTCTRLKSSLFKGWFIWDCADCKQKCCNYLCEGGCWWWTETIDASDACDRVVYRPSDGPPDAPPPIVECLYQYEYDGPCKPRR